jgi:hypothetical protein
MAPAREYKIALGGLAVEDVQAKEAKMFLVNQIKAVSLMITLCILVSSVAFAVHKGDLRPMEEPKPRLENNRSKDHDQGRVPAYENSSWGRQPGHFEKTDCIQAILDEEAKIILRYEGRDRLTAGLPRISLQQGEKELPKPFLWGNDVTISTGLCSGGISADYDTSGNMYAVRCTTYNYSSNAMVQIFKSADGGASWFWLCGFYAVDGAFSFSYPVVLTGAFGYKLYVLCLRSTQNGDITMARFTQSGTWEAFYDVKADADTISYFSACTNYGLGWPLMVAYQKEEAGRKLFTIMSSDSGETWGNQAYITDDGAHPDMAYGAFGYVYLVYEKGIGADREIMFGRSPDYCFSWEEFEYLTADIWADNYPKVAAVHTSPEDTACVWVAYNHDYSGTGDMDLRYAYSTNSGKTWSKNHDLAASPSYDETASDLKVYRSPIYSFVELCYLKSTRKGDPSTVDVYHSWASSSLPVQFYAPHARISDYSPHSSPDGREVCRILFSDPSFLPGVVYAGAPREKASAWNLYFDYNPWTDVQEVVEEALLTGFSVSANYPNPFNPVTTIRYTVGGKQPYPIPVTLRVYNVLGQLVITLVDESRDPGAHEASWDGRDQRGQPVASGVYFYSLEAGGFAETKKMILLR